MGVFGVVGIWGGGLWVWLGVFGFGWGSLGSGIWGWGSLGLGLGFFGVVGIWGWGSLGLWGWGSLDVGGLWGGFGLGVFVVRDLGWGSLGWGSLWSPHLRFADAQVGRGAVEAFLLLDALLDGCGAEVWGGDPTKKGRPHKSVGSVGHKDTHGPHKNHIS